MNKKITFSMISVALVATSTPFITLSSCGQRQTQFNVVGLSSANLVFTSMSGQTLMNIKAYEKQDFKFKMKAVNVDGDEYDVPTSLNILVGQTPLQIGSDYSINFISSTEADVTINADKITNDIVVSGSAIKLNKYHIDIVVADNLQFTTLDDKPLMESYATQNRPLIFKMKAVNEQISNANVIPTTLDIRIGDGTPPPPPLVSGYRIDPINNTEANVTIEASKIEGKVSISGSAAVGGKCNYNVSAHNGLTVTPNTSGEFDVSNNLVLTFSPESSYQLPKKENILIGFDDTPGELTWISPSMPGVENEYCSYDETTGVLTIKPNHVRNNIDIKTRAFNFQLLESMSWKEISQRSFNGEAPYIFYLGEQKKVKIGDIDYQVQIIDFEHDTIIGGTTKAGITFDFVSPIQSFTVAWNSPVIAFDTSLLNKCLQPEGYIYDKIPTDMLPYLKQVTKTYVGLGIDSHSAPFFQKKNYETKLFPLSVEEIDPTKTSEDIYAFYQSSEMAKRKKGEAYWLRSPDENTLKIFSVEPSGEVVSKTKTSDKLAVAPAFCV